MRCTRVGDSSRRKEGRRKKEKRRGERKKSWNAPTRLFFLFVSVVERGHTKKKKLNLVAEAGLVRLELLFNLIVACLLGLLGTSATAHVSFSLSVKKDVFSYE